MSADKQDNPVGGSSSGQAENPEASEDAGPAPLDFDELFYETAEQAPPITPPPGNKTGCEQAGNSFPAGDSPHRYTLRLCPYAGECQATTKKGWRKRHPLLFGLLVIVTLGILLNLIFVLAAYLDRHGVLSGPRLGLVRVEGVLLDSGPVLEWCERLRADPSVKGVLLHVNSPGGAVVPSQEIYMAVRRLAASKPVVVYMGAAAASGGYYAALGGDWIVASPSTLTGSIGVRMQMAEMKDLFDFLGIHRQDLSSGPYKEAGTPFRPMREDEREYLQGLVKDMHEVFAQTVAERRALSPAAAHELADGRAFTGLQAKNLKLVDEIGDMGAAQSALLQRCGLKEAGEYLEGPKKEASWLLRLITGTAEDVARARAALAGPAPAFYY